MKLEIVIETDAKEFAEDPRKIVNVLKRTFESRGTFDHDLDAGPIFWFGERIGRFSYSKE